MQVLAQKCVKKWPGKIHPKSRENPVQIFDRILKSQNLNFFRETSFWPNFEKNLLTVRCDLAEISADNPNSVNYLQNFGKNLLTGSEDFFQDLVKSNIFDRIRSEDFFQFLSKILLKCWKLGRLPAWWLDKFWTDFGYQILEKIFWPGQKIFSKIWSNQKFRNLKISNFGDSTFFQFLSKKSQKLNYQDFYKNPDAIWHFSGPIRRPTVQSDTSPKWWPKIA